MPRISPGELRDLGFRARQLDAAALAAAAGVDLRLDDPDRTAELLRRLGRFADAERGIAARHGDAEAGQDFLALIFVNLHRGSALRCRKVGAFSPAHAREIAEKCSTRLRPGEPGAAKQSAAQGRAACAENAVLRPARAARSRRLRSRERRNSRIRRCTSSGEKPRPSRKRDWLARSASIARRGGKAPRPNRHRARPFGLVEIARQLPRQGERVLRQLALDAQVAEASLARMDARLERSDRRTGSDSPRASRAASRSRRRRRPSAHRRRRRRARPARAWRSSFRRSSSRLWSRCASSCRARDLSERGCLCKAQSLTTFSLAGASSVIAPGRSGMPTAARTLFSISTARSGFSFRNSRALSLPWPIFSPL